MASDHTYVSMILDLCAIDSMTRAVSTITNILQDNILQVLLSYQILVVLVMWGAYLLTWRLWGLQAKSDRSVMSSTTSSYSQKPTVSYSDTTSQTTQSDGQSNHSAENVPPLAIELTVKRLVKLANNTNERLLQIQLSIREHRDLVRAQYGQIRDQGLLKRFLTGPRDEKKSRMVELVKDPVTIEISPGDDSLSDDEQINRLPVLGDANRTIPNPAMPASTGTGAINANGNTISAEMGSLIHNELKSFNANLSQIQQNQLNIQHNTSLYNNNQQSEHGQGKRARQVTCYGCHVIGHLRSSCPQVLCYNCKQMGHTQWKCPLPNNYQRNNSNCSNNQQGAYNPCCCNPNGPHSANQGAPHNQSALQSAAAQAAAVPIIN